MKITWLGQAGLMFETCGKTVIVDPYLSDSVAKINPINARRVPVDERFWAVKPDILLFTHDHLDHIDPESIAHYLPDSRVLVLASDGGCQKVRSQFGSEPNRMVVATPGLTWTEGEIVIYTVYASHSDPNAVGYILSAEGKNYYVTGDTLYHEKVFASLPDLPLEAVFLPINGFGNNMNAVDAARFALRTKAKFAVPLHFGLFDSFTGDLLQCPNRVIPSFFEEIRFPGAPLQDL